MTREDQLAHIFSEVASGRALTRVLDEDENMPGRATFWRWHMEDESIRDNLARARENGVEVHMEEALAIADQTMEGETVTVGPEGPITKREDMLGHRKLQIETRLKRAAMIKPRKYGPKVDLAHSGSINISISPDIYKVG